MWAAILFGTSGILLAGLLALKALERSAGTVYVVPVRRHLDKLILKSGRLIETWSSVAVRSVSHDVVLKSVHGISVLLLLLLRSLEGTLTHWVVRVRAKRRSLSDKNVRKLLFSATQVDRKSAMRDAGEDRGVPE